MGAAGTLFGGGPHGASVAPLGTLFARPVMPSLGGTTGWLDSEPLGPAELRGHVVLVN